MFIQAQCPFLSVHPLPLTPKCCSPWNEQSQAPLPVEFDEPDLQSAVLVQVEGGVPAEVITEVELQIKERAEW